MSRVHKLSETAATGDRLATLEALRATLADAIEDCSDAGDLSSLALRLQRVLAEIHELGGKAADEDTDVLAERRKAKLSAASGS